MLRLLILMSSLMLAACGGPPPPLPAGSAAYDVLPADTGSLDDAYRISPRDVVAVTVFREPDLTFDRVTVDASGALPFPLIGSVQAAGRTPTELADLLTARLNQRYLRNPQVTVNVVSSITQQVTVEGQVISPGVYPILGRTTLLDAMALAKSPSQTAKLDEIVVFRMVDGQRLGAVFDLKAIRSGRAPDPRLQGGDRVVVGYSALRGAQRDFLQAVPLLAIFRPF